MAEKTSGNSSLAFIVGALVVAVGVMAYFMMGGGLPGSNETTITIETPEIDLGGNG